MISRPVAACRSSKYHGSYREHLQEPANITVAGDWERGQPPFILGSPPAVDFKQSLTMTANQRFTGLIAATHTPFDDDGEIQLDAIERQAEHLIRSGVTAAFVCGSTGEGQSLSTDERLAMMRRWAEVTRGSRLQVVCHVGHNSQADAKVLAADALRQGAVAISALSPSYFKPSTAADLVDFLAPIAAAAGDLPFYFYDIPALTGVSLPLTEFLSLGGDAIPNLVGVKFTNMDSIQLQACLHHEGGRFEILYGIDECLLSGITYGCRGAVGSSYNFAAAIYHRIMAALDQKDLAAARADQIKSIGLIRMLVGYGYLPAAKAVMTLLGVPVGPPRAPLRRLTAAETARLEREIKASEYWDDLKSGIC